MLAVVVVVLVMLRHLQVELVVVALAVLLIHPQLLELPILVAVAVVLEVLIHHKLQVLADQVLLFFLFQLQIIQEQQLAVQL